MATLDFNRAPYLDKLRVYMDDSAHHIHASLETVAALRQQRAASPALTAASLAIKRFQARRFQATYADLLHSPRYKGATAFFLQELYGDKDYSERDQQFGRIADTIERIFPQPVVKTASALADVHALTEHLDDLMAREWLQKQGLETAHLTPAAIVSPASCAQYIRCWRRVGDAGARAQQLEVVIQLGQQLDSLTRKIGLRTLLKMMRLPASAAGLSALQTFLESGFDAFAGMRGADEFLKLIRLRETEWIRALFDDEAVTCETKLHHLLTAGQT